MKNLLISLLCLIWVLTALAQNKIELPSKDTLKPKTLMAGAPYISFEEKTYRFPTMKQGAKLNYIFRFTNTGDKPLLLYQVQTSCGCTATKWSNAPIAPNQQGEIEVIFDTTNKLGPQNKVILVISNASNKEEKLTLTGELIKGE